MDYIATASAMREQAWAELIASPAFRAFRAADNMMVELGEASAMPNLPIAPATSAPKTNRVVVEVRRRVRVASGQEKPTQTEAAEAVLRELGPMGTKDVMDFSVERGARAGGVQPLVNFRSALSKDDKFYSFRHNGEYYWWLTGVSLPEGWDETTADLLDQTVVSDSNDQEGGDDHAATMT